MTQDPPSVALPKKPQFDVARRGYEPSQVDQHIAKLHREMAQLTANLRQERDARRLEMLAFFQRLDDERFDVRFRGFLAEHSRG